MNNLYGMISNDISKKNLEDKFKKMGWKIRKSGFDEYEINGEKEILLNGEVLVDRFEDLEKELLNLKLSYKLAIYDNDNQLIKTVSSPN